MKKAILLLAFPLALTACGGGGPEDDAQEICDMMKEFGEAQKAGDEAKMEEIETKGKARQKELKEKYKDDEKGWETLDKTVEECEEKYIK